GTPFSVYYRTLITNKLGAQIDLLTYGEGADVAIPGLHIYRIPRFAGLGKVKVGPSFLKLFLDFFLILYTLFLLIKNRYDVVHAHEEAIFFCRFLKPIFGFQLIYDMHSSLPQQLTNFQFSSSKILIWLFKKLEDSCLKKADAVITICPDLADYVNSQIEDKDKHFLIENSIFESVQLAAPASPTHKKTTTAPGEEDLFPVQSPYVIYAGTLEPYQGIDILIPAFALFSEKKPDYRLLIVGGTPEQVKKYSALASDYGINNKCSFTGQVSQPEAKDLCSKADILVSPRSRGTNTPLKIYEQLASGIPLVATRIYSHTQVLNDSLAFLVDTTPEDMAKGLLEAATGQSAADKVKNARKLYDEYYSQDRYIEKLRRLFDYLNKKKA
ncbi:MAG: hypothetical protein DSY50_07840, partial [Desulfobulbus sp.]